MANWFTRSSAPKGCMPTTTTASSLGKRNSAISAPSAWAPERRRYFTRLLVERDDERRLTILFITLNDHEVLKKYRRRAGAHADGAEIAELRFPSELAVVVVGIQPFGAEERVNQFAVSCRS